MELNRRHLIHLAAVVRHGNVTRAAQELGITQPALSRSIHEVERILGLLCFDRMPQGVVPTSACRALLERANDVIAGFEQLEREAQRLAGSFAGSLTVGFGPGIATGSAMLEVGLLIARHPKLEVRVVIAPPVELLRQLQSLELDFYVGDQTPALPVLDSLVVDSVAHAGYWLCRDGHPILRAASPLAEVTRYPVAVLTTTPAVLESLRAALREGDPALRPGWMPALDFGAAPALEALLLDSDFVGGSVPHAHAAALRSGALRLLPDSRPVYEGRVGPVRLRDRTLSPAAEALWKAIGEALRIEIGAVADLVASSNPR